MKSNQILRLGIGGCSLAGNAENAENLLVIRSPELAGKYAANWKKHQEHSAAYESRR